MVAISDGLIWIDGIFQMISSSSSIKMNIQFQWIIGGYWKSSGWKPEVIFNFSPIPGFREGAGSLVNVHDQLPGTYCRGKPASPIINHPGNHPRDLMPKSLNFPPFSYRTPWFMALGLPHSQHVWEVETFSPRKCLSYWKHAAHLLRRNWADWMWGFLKWGYP